MNKNPIYSLILLIPILFSLYSCKKDNDNNDCGDFETYLISDEIKDWIIYDLNDTVHFKVIEEGYINDSVITFW